MPSSRAVAAVVAVVLACWTLSAAALDRVRAIEVAKAETKQKCDPFKPCTFTADRQGDKWHVRVDFPKRKDPKGKTVGGHAIYIINQTGKIVGRIERK